MTLKEIAEKFIENCRTGQEMKGLAELYSPNAVSVEAAVMPGMGSAASEGVEAIKGKHAWWEANFEAHDAQVTGPFFHGDDRFAVIFEVDATEKNSGQRTKMEEVAIYTVENGKIVREEFFYDTDG